MKLSYLAVPAWYLPAFVLAQWHEVLWAVWLVGFWAAMIAWGVGHTLWKERTDETFRFAKSIHGR
jgi:hypothetical protein